MSPNTSIRQATKEDLEAIMVWLKEENEKKVEGCFWCNRNTICKSLEKQELIVLVDHSSNSPIAFLASDMGGKTICIIEVRSEWRGKGFGRSLVSHYIKHARHLGLPGLFVQREPESSVPFWNHMGFRELPPQKALRESSPFQDNRMAILLLDTPLQYDKEETCRLIVNVQVETEQHDHLTSLLIGARRSWNCNEIKSLQLERRFVLFSASDDPYITFTLNGHELCPREKLKYTKMDLNRDHSPFWYCDTLLIEKWTKDFTDPFPASGDS